MAVAADAVSAGQGASNFTFNHTVASDANYLFVQVSQNCTGVTFNGVAMTLLSSYHPTFGTFAGNCPYVIVYGLANPDVGTHTVSVTINAGGIEDAVATSYKNILDVTHGNDSASVGGQTSTWESTATLATNEWEISFFAGANNNARTLQAYTNATLRQANTGGDYPISIMDCGGIQTPGSYSVWCQWSSGSGFITATTFVVSVVPTTMTKSEAVTVTDSLIKTSTKAMSEVLTIVDSVTKSLSKSFAEALALVDTFSTIKGTSYTKALTEVVTLTGSMVTSFVFYITKTETVTITDAVLDFAKKLRGLIRGKKADTNTKIGVRRT